MKFLPSVNILLGENGYKNRRRENNLIEEFAWKCIVDCVDVKSAHTSRKNVLVNQKFNCNVMFSNQLPTVRFKNFDTHK